MTFPLTHRIAPAEFEGAVPVLAELFRETVNSGVPMGFMPPLSDEQSRDYWLSLRGELQAGTRVLLAACSEEGIVGSGQVVLSQRPNSPHRAELQKIFVAMAWRGRGVGRMLLTALHDTARGLGRSLIHLNTRQGHPAESFYKRLGYHEAGVYPGWTLGPKGERNTHVTLYRELSSQGNFS